MMDLPNTRAEALASGAKYYFTGKPCKHGHVDRRFTMHRRCMGCARMWESIYARRNPEKYKAKWAARNRQKARDYARKQRETNRDVVYARTAAWFRANPDKARAYARGRAAAKLMATPSWADKRLIEAVYTVAAGLQRETGIKHDVDHIIPLRGRNVCGLHVHYNLRAVPMSVNRRKHNKVEDGDHTEYLY